MSVVSLLNINEAQKMTRGIVIFLLLMIQIPVLADEDQSPNYLVSIFSGGLPQKEYLANLKISNNQYLITSEVARTINLQAMSNVTSVAVKPEAGQYKVTITNHEKKNKIFKVQLEHFNDSIKITGENNISIYLTPYENKTNYSVAKKWALPFMAKNRKDLKLLFKKAFGKYGDYRSSKKKGHKHAGIDIKGNWNELFYAMSEGQVMFVSHHDLNSMVLIKHYLPDGAVVYSKYAHLKKVELQPGQHVNKNTKLGILFDKKTFKRSGYKFNHVHLEIRQDYSDKGRASSYSMSMDELNKFCINPLNFLKKHIE